MFGNLASFNQLSLSTIYIYIHVSTTKSCSFCGLNLYPSGLKCQDAAAKEEVHQAFSQVIQARHRFFCLQPWTRDDDLKNLEFCWMDTLYIRSSSMASLRPVVPQWGKSLSWGSHNSNFTMVYGRYIELVFMGFINQHSHHWGEHHLVGQP